MGDGADMALDSIDWAEEFCFAEPFWEYPYKNCNRCGEGNLSWHKDKKGQWRLKNRQGHWHVCWKKELKGFEIRFAVNGEVL